jgi:hypothetical protein
VSAYEHPTALTLASALTDPSIAAQIENHVDICLACRVRMARLQHSTSETEVPSQGSVQRILDASSPGPLVLEKLTVTDDAAPLPGQLWRVGRDEALLVWVRRVFDGALDVIPAVLDVELADEETLLVPASDTPLGMDLALMTSVRGRVDRRAFLQLLGQVDAAEQVEALLTAVRTGQPPGAIQTGPTISDERDQRIEYRQVLADLLLDLSPTMWDQDDGSAEDEEDFLDVERLFQLLAEELPLRHRGVIVVGASEHKFAIDRQNCLVATARVSYLDTSLIVALLDGELTVSDLVATTLAEACLDIVRSEPDADAVAISGVDEEWSTIILPVPDMRMAYEPPGGSQRGPRIPMDPMPAVDAIAKYLDRQVTAWEITEPQDSVVVAADIPALAARFAEAALAQVVVEGRRAHTPAKKEAWTSLSAETIGRIAEAIVAISGNEPPDEIVQALKSWLGER